MDYNVSLKLMNHALTKFKSHFNSIQLKPYRCNPDVTTGYVTQAKHILDSLKAIKSEYEFDIESMCAAFTVLSSHESFRAIEMCRLDIALGRVSFRAVGELESVLAVFEGMGSIDAKDSGKVLEAYKAHERLNKAIKRYRNAPSEVIKHLLGLCEAAEWFENELYLAASLPANRVSAFRAPLSHSEILRDSGYQELGLTRQPTAKIDFNVFD